MTDADHDACDERIEQIKSEVDARFAEVYARLDELALLVGARGDDDA